MEPLIEVKDLSQEFHLTKGLLQSLRLEKGRIVKQDKVVHAVNQVSFQMEKGEVFSLVGESGCGKSTTARTIIRLLEPSGGQVLYKGTDISHLSAHELLPYRKSMQMIFQDPYASLNPRQRVEEIIMEPMLFHGIAKDRKDAREQCMDILNRVGLRPEQAGRYPHQFSGGQRQRIGIARALAVDPEFIVCDEPISALDVSIQAQVVNMLEDLQREFGLTYLFIAHDLSMVRHISNRIGVMYLGKLVEVGDSEEIYQNHLHPYTEALLSSVPLPDPELAHRSEPIMLQGDIPSPIDPPSGCRFRTRCPYATDKCKEAVPEFKEHAPGHWAACHLLG